MQEKRDTSHKDQFREYLTDTWKNRAIPHDLVPYHERLKHIIHIHAFSEVEAERIHLAETVLFEAMDGAKPRKDGKRQETHSYDVTFLVEENGGSSHEIVISLLHDTIEDSKKNHLPITTQILASIFDQHTADIVDSLTKAKSENNRDLPHQTHHKLLNLIGIDPPSVPVKLLDRLHGMRTIEFLKPEVQRYKALETLDIYVPLAKILGLHQLASELMHLSETVLWNRTTLRLRLPGEWYTDVQQRFHQSLMNLHGIEKVRTYVRTPTIADAYKYANGELKRIQSVDVPVFATVVVPSGGLIGDQYELKWKQTIISTCLQLQQSHLLSAEQAKQVISNLMDKNPMNSKRFTVTVDSVPVLIQFVNQQDDDERNCSIYEIYGDDGLKQMIAHNKINALRHTYQTLMKITPSIRMNIADFKEYLQRGVLTVYDKDGVVYAMPRGATVMDFVMSISHSKVQRFAVSAVDLLGKHGESNMELDAVLQNHQHVHIVLDPEVQHISPDWIDKATTIAARRKIHDYFANRVRNERYQTGSLIQQEETTRLVAHGKQRLEQEITGHIREKLGFIPPVRVDLSKYMDILKNIPMRYMTEGDDTERRIRNFYISIALREINHDSSAPVSDIIDAVVEAYVQARAKVIIPNRPGGISEALRPIQEVGINIVYMTLAADRINQDEQELTIYVDPRDRELLIKILAEQYI